MKSRTPGSRGQEQDHREYTYSGPRPKDGYSDELASPFPRCDVQDGSAARPMPKKDPRGEHKFGHY